MDMEGPGRIAGLCQERGLEVEIRHVYAGDVVPEQIARDEILIVMGGGMGVGDVEGPRYPFLRREVALIERALADGRAVLGVCLGAQLLAHAAGARVYPHVVLGSDGREVRVREVGWGPVRFLESRRNIEPALAGMAAEQMALHWHGDTFDLPPGAVHLAATPVCPHQAFRLGSRVFGLQFHVEADAEIARRWAVEDAAFVAAARGPGGTALILAETDQYAADATIGGDRLIRNILGCMTA